MRHELATIHVTDAAGTDPMREVRALRRLRVGPLDLAVERECCVSIAERSGSGKSVLLRMIANLDPSPVWLP